MTQLKQNVNDLVICRYLIIFELITILFSPAISNLLEIMLFAFCILSPHLRAHIFKQKNQPLVLGSIAFICILVISTTWSVASQKETFESLWAWRKILLLPIAITLFQEDLWKEKMLKVFIFLSFVACTISYISFFLNYSIHGYEPGVLLRSHTTQGVIFSVAAFTVFMNWMTVKPSQNKLTNILCIFFIIALALDVTWFSISRSGYLALLTLTMISLVCYVVTKRKILAPVIISLLIPILIWVSPNAATSIHRGINEIQKVDEISAPTSMGLRVKLWTNTIEMIKEKPLLGVGVGGFETAYSEKMKGAPEWQKYILYDPHNQFLKIIAELGLIGLVVFIYMLATAFFQEPHSKKHKLLGLSVLIIWCGTGMFNSSFSTFSDARFLYIWLGVMLASNAPAKSIS